MRIQEVRIGNILTRSSGYLAPIASHSLQPYRGCSLGRSLCGVGCYVQHNYFLTRGDAWGSFLDIRVNAAEAYRRQASAERRWARAHRAGFAIFLSSSTDPFLPQERRFGITRAVLETMCDEPPDTLILQTHSHHVIRYQSIYRSLAARTRLRFHITIETDHERLPGLPPPSSTVAARLRAACELKAAGFEVVITVAPLLPIQDPDSFFRRIADAASAVVIDHFIEGDGSIGGKRTQRTALPAAMERIDPSSLTLEYRNRMVHVARRWLPGRVGVSAAGFAGDFA